MKISVLAILLLLGFSSQAQTKAQLPAKCLPTAQMLDVLIPQVQTIQSENGIRSEQVVKDLDGRNYFCAYHQMDTLVKNIGRLAVVFDQMVLAIQSGGCTQEFAQLMTNIQAGYKSLAAEQSEWSQMAFMIIDFADAPDAATKRKTCNNLESATPQL